MKLVALALALFLASAVVGYALAPSPRSIEVEVTGGRLLEVAIEVPR